MKGDKSAGGRGQSFAISPQPKSLIRLSSCGLFLSSTLIPHSLMRGNGFKILFNLFLEVTEWRKTTCWESPTSLLQPLVARRHTRGHAIRLVHMHKERALMLMHTLYEFLYIGMNYASVGVTICVHVSTQVSWLYIYMCTFMCVS